MKRLLFILSLIPLFYSFSFGQGWHGLYGTGEALGAIELEDGSFMVLTDSQLLKVDSTGRLLWSQPIIGSTLSEGDSNTVVVGYGGQFVNPPSLTKYDENGQVVWENRFEGYEIERFISCIKSQDGGYLVLGEGIAPVDGPETYIFKADSVGNLLWGQLLQFESFDLFTELSNGNILLGFSSGVFRLLNATGEELNNLFIDFFDPDVFVFWTDMVAMDDSTALVTAVGGGTAKFGNLSTSYLTSLGGTLDFNGSGFFPQAWCDPDPLTVEQSALRRKHGKSIIRIDEDRLAISGIGFLPAGPGNDCTPKISLSNINAESELYWQRIYSVQALETEFANDVIHTKDGGFLLTGSSGNKVLLIKTDGEGNVFPTHINGRIALDEEKDCIIQVEDLGLDNWIIEAVGNETYYGISDANGNYFIDLDTGQYLLNYYPPSPYWEACESDIVIDLPNQDDTSTVDLAGLVEIACPQLEVSVSTPFLRRCFENTYTVQYRNSGTQLAEEAYLEIILDSSLIFLDADLPVSMQDGQLITFELGDIPIQGNGQFSFRAEVSCEADLGQTHCVQAHIYPDSACLPSNPLWDGSSIIVDGICIGDSLYFLIQNIGDGDMSEPLDYFVVEDELILMQESFQLLADESLELYFDPMGATYRLEAEQALGHPFAYDPSIVIEGCGQDDNGLFTIGLVNQFVLGDGPAYIDIDCQPNIGSFDPNDKYAFPTGYKEEHFIEANVPIEYHIRFQNTGTDTAFKVVIQDQLDEHLDIRTLKPGASSHTYQMDLLPHRTLQFTFDDIMLPDSNVNEAASHGFVRFKIDQLEDLPLGTKIYNDAAIFFDFNAPIITNQTKHTIGRDFIKIKTSVFEPFENVQLQVFPNPTSSFVIIELEGLNFNELELQLFQLDGTLIKVWQDQGNRFEINMANFSSGLYLFKVNSKAGPVAGGKIVVR